MTVAITLCLPIQGVQANQEKSVQYVLPRAMREKIREKSGNSANARENQGNCS